MQANLLNMKYVCLFIHDSLAIIATLSLGWNVFFITLSLPFNVNGVCVVRTYILNLKQLKMKMCIYRFLLLLRPQFLFECWQLYCRKSNATILIHSRLLSFWYAKILDVISTGVLHRNRAIVSCVSFKSFIISIKLSVISARE